MRHTSKLQFILAALCSIFAAACDDGGETGDMAGNGGSGGMPGGGAGAPAANVAALFAAPFAAPFLVTCDEHRPCLERVRTTQRPLSNLTGLEMFARSATAIRSGGAATGSSVRRAYISSFVRRRNVSPTSESSSCVQVC